MFREWFNFGGLNRNFYRYRCCRFFVVAVVIHVVVVVFVNVVGVVLNVVFGARAGLNKNINNFHRGLYKFLKQPLAKGKQEFVIKKLLKSCQGFSL